VNDNRQAQAVHRIAIFREITISNTSSPRFVTTVLLCVYMIMRLRSSVNPECDSYTGVDDQAWLISFMDSDLGLFDSERGQVETGPIGLKVWASQIRSSGYMSQFG